MPLKKRLLSNPDLTYVQRVVLKRGIGVFLLSVGQSALAIEGTAYSSTSGLLTSVWGTYGQGTVGIDTTTYTLSSDFALLSDRSIQWNTGSRPPPVGETVGTPAGTYFRNVIIQSVGGQKHALTITNSGPARKLSAEKLSITNSRLVLRDDVTFNFQSPSGSYNVILDNSDLIFDWTSAEPSFYADANNKLIFDIRGTSLI
ncbi:hypothetical protein A3715_04135 [Oleiphilus sp. HI0009]|nr:hypothetical protein A3715_04135 [Oleiphilus sp. HI0009]KZY63509.1 hypothetical protein A3738_11650 [Oleiphilus sp. HI0066]KZY67455.1 hypothetical protein A3739_12600 [Oleiphilus sp. HI0067]